MSVKKKLRQVLVTPSMGKRLIAKALSKHPTVKNAIENGTLVIVAGTTNGYVAEEILQLCGCQGFSRGHFFRGITLPPTKPTTSEGRLKDETMFSGDVVISRGKWLRGKTIQDLADSLVEGDVIIKGANALDLEHKQAAILIGHPKAGTAAIAIQAVAGRRVKLILAVGLEKRVSGSLTAMAEKLNSPGATGHRLLPLPGQVFTELDAINSLTCATAALFAAGGVCGAEGSCWLEITGTKEQEEAAQKIITSFADEPPFKID